MVGKDCVAIACDKRFGQQGLTIGTEFPKIYEMQGKLYLGLAGLATDVQTLYAFCLPLFFCLPLRRTHSHPHLLDMMIKFRPFNIHITDRND